MTLCTLDMHVIIIILYNLTGIVKIITLNSAKKACLAQHSVMVDILKKNQLRYKMFPLPPPKSLYSNEANNIIIVAIYS